VSDAVPTRDPVETARTLQRWLEARLDVEGVAVTDLSVPKAGFSNETILGTAMWVDATDDADEDKRVVEFVLRIEPTGHQLFVEPDALRQAEVMSALAGHVPVPRVWLTESDQTVLGAPFFMMERVHGRIPSDVPSWHQKGWTLDLSPTDRTTLHDHALQQLANLHAIDTAPVSFRFLETADDMHSHGSALARYVSHLHTWYEWCEPVLTYGADVIDAAMQYVTEEVPSDSRQSVVWGDARVGNIIFGDDLSVAAMLDWEGATLGPPEIDVAWWVMFDEFLCEAKGLTRLDGVADRVQTFERYQTLSGHQLQNIGYFEVLAGLTLSLINSRLAHLLITTGKAPEQIAAEFVTRVTAITNRSLNRVAGN
jgi:aminoglycoside phosphotransferase (APT) family kinase protein